MNRELIEKYLQGTLTATEAAALALALSESPALADEFAAATRLESELAAAHKEAAHTSLYERRLQRAAAEAEPAGTRRRWWKPAAAAAGVALLAGSAWAWLNSTRGTIAGNTPVNSSFPREEAPTAASNAAAPGGSLSGGLRTAGAAAIRRQLRKFIDSSSTLESMPVSRALSMLESKWRNYAHRIPEDRDAVSFSLAASAKARWANEEEEPKVSVGILGTSLLTSAELIAAQAGLELKVTDRGVVLEPESRPDDGKARNWSIPLAAASLDDYLSRAASLRVSSQLRSTSWSGLINTWDDFGAANAGQNSNRSYWGYQGIPWSRPGINGLQNHVYFSPPGVQQANFAGNASDGITNPVRIVGIDEDNISSDATPSSPATSEGLSKTPVLVYERQFVDGANNLRGWYYPEAGAGDANQESPDPSLGVVNGRIETFLPGYSEAMWSTPDGGQVVVDSFIIPPADRQIWRLVPPGSDSPEQTFQQLLANHGGSGLETKWDREAGAVNLTGPLPALRAASATIAAIQEAAAMEVTVRAQVLTWESGPPAGTGPAESGIITPAVAAALIRKAGAVTELSPATGQPGAALQMEVPVVAAPSGSGGLLPTPNISIVKGDTTVENISVSPGGLSLHLSATVRHGDELTVQGTASKTASASGGETVAVTTSLSEGDCYRCEFAASGKSKAATVILRVQAGSRPR